MRAGRRITPRSNIASLHFPGREPLTRREREVLEQFTSGASNKEAGRQLGISPRTIEDHRANIMKKLGARNAADLIRIVMTAQRGVVTSLTPTCSVMPPEAASVPAAFIVSRTPRIAGSSAFADDDTEETGERRSLRSASSALRIITRHVRLAIGLGEQQHAGIEPAVMNDRIFGVARGEQHLQAGLASSAARRQAGGRSSRPA